MTDRRTDPPKGVDIDDAAEEARPTGGVPDPSQPDQGSTTGTTPDEMFVGRVAGQDVGYAGEQVADRLEELAAEQDDDR